MIPKRTRLNSALAAAFVALALFGGAAAALAQATNPPPANPGDIIIEEPIPQSALEKSVSGAATGTVKGVADYINRIYNFAIGVVGLVAAVMMIIGGFQYLVSAGDAGKIGAARKRITDALIGLVLALGSYALLNSLNPDIVNLKPLTVEKDKVNTRINFLPWCEDIIKKGYTVTAISNMTECGGVGSYKAGNTESPCVYYGSCDAVKGSGSPKESAAFYVTPGTDKLWRTCLQRIGETDANGVIIPFDAPTVLTKARAQAGAVFGICMNCSSINTQNIKVLGMDNLSTACNAWDAAINAHIKEKLGDGSQYWSSCIESSDNPSCEQTDIDCQAADDNSDESIDTSQCGNNDANCGCEGYDDSPETHITKIGSDNSHKDDGHDNLDSSEDHLRVVCYANPCKNYKNTKNSQQNYLNGCSMVNRTDCRNVGRDTLLKKANGNVFDVTF